MPDQKFDLVVGAGPGGYVAAIRAAQLGIKIAVVEREHLSGICLNWGCIPTRAQFRTSEIYRTLQNLDQFGLMANEIGCDTKKVVERSRKVAKQLSDGIRAEGKLGASGLPLSDKARTNYADTVYTRGS